MQFLTCVLILFSTPVAKTRVAPFADGVMEAAIHKRCWKSLLSRQFPRWPYHREVLSDFIEGSVYQWSPADALLEDRQSTHRQNLSPHKPFNKGESKRVKQTWSDSLDFDAFTSQKNKMAESNVRLIFKCWLWWIQAVQWLTWLACLRSSPPTSHSIPKPHTVEKIQKIYAIPDILQNVISCVIMWHILKMAKIFRRKIFLKKHPSANILWSIRNYWLVQLVMNELMKRLHANYWAKNPQKKTPTSSSLKSRSNWIFQWHLLQPVKEHWLLKLETIQIWTSSVMT